MKKLFLILAILFCAACANAWTISWDALDNADGYYLNYGLVNDQVFTNLDMGSQTSQNIDDLGLTRGERYEFFVKAHAGGNSFGESDHLRWTYPSQPVIIDLPPEERIIINIHED